MAEDIVNATITFKTGGGDRGTNKDLKSTLQSVQDIEKNLKKLLTGNLTGLIGGGGGLVEAVLSGVGRLLTGTVGGIIAGVVGGVGGLLGLSTFFKGLGGEIGQTTPSGERLDVGLGGVDEIIVDNIDEINKTTDAVANMIVDFEQTPEIIRNINLETREVTTNLVTAETQGDRIVNNLSENLILSDELNNSLSNIVIQNNKILQQLDIAFQKANRVARLGGGADFVSAAIATVADADIGSADLVSGLPSGQVLRGTLQRIGLQTSVSLGGKVK